MKIKRHSTVTLILTACAAVLLTLGVLFVTAWMTVGVEGLALVEGMFLINTQFVGDYDKATVRDRAMSGLVAGLEDRWSYYLSPKQYAATKEQRSNTYVGIGLTVTYTHEEGLYIESITEGGPAQQAGVQAGEIITAVDGMSVSGEARDTATDLIKGKAGTALLLTLLDETGRSREVTITRVKVDVEPVEYALLKDGVGYVKLKNFYERSADALIAAVEALQVQGATALVFDMRNNGGGYLNQLTRMLDFLLPEGPIFRARNRADQEQITYSDASCVELPMAVLVNESTYSAAEFFAGELQEQGVGIIVGTETSGKGYSQQTFPLIGGGAVGISTSKYVTGEGKSLIGTGLTLDREVTLSEEKNTQFSAGNLPYEEDDQLQAALDLLAHF